MGKAKAPKARVVMLIENLSFPMDRRMYQEAMALQENGYEVSVICPEGQHHDNSSFEVVNDVRVYRYKLHLEATGGFGYLIEYAWSMLRTTILLWRILLTRGFDIVHAANPPDLFFAAALPFILMGKKFVYDQHDLCPEVYEAKFARRDLAYNLLLWLEKLSYQAADLVICPNLSYFDIAVSRGRVPSQNLCIVRSGPDLRNFHKVAPQARLKRGFRYLLAYLGVMARQDGVDRVLYAAHHLIKTMGRRDVGFVCIGKGECWGDLRQLAERLDISEYVEFTGRIPDSDVIAYLSSADVCLAPDPQLTLNNLSTMNKILEYMACHKPIVSFDLCEARRSAGGAALYVERDDPALFAQAIERLLEDEALRLQMGELGFERVSGQVSWERSKLNLVEGYSRIAAA